MNPKTMFRLSIAIFILAKLPKKHTAKAPPLDPTEDEHPEGY